MAVSVLIREERVRDWDRWRALLCQTLGPARGMVAYESFIQAWDLLKERGCRGEVMGIRFSLHFRGLEKEEVRRARDTVGWAVDQLRADGFLVWWRGWGRPNAYTAVLVFPTPAGVYQITRRLPLSNLPYRVVQAVEGRLGKHVNRVWEKEQ